MSRPFTLFGVAVICLALGGALGWDLGTRSAHPRPAPAPVLGRAPAYHGLINQLGQPVDSTRFAGKVQVVTFLFPYCTTYCPLIAAHLVGLENLLKIARLQDRVQIVAFDVDPAGTGPAQMRAFLKEYGWNPRDLRWQYLTGSPAVIRKIVTGGFHIAYEKVPAGADAEAALGPEQTPQPEVVNPLAERAKVDYDISHNDALILVDPKGRVRHIYTQADVVSNAELLARIQALLGRRHA